ncbi:GGDEF domain-containing protein [Arenimonas sp. MALMAid1274]|uniref:GGDEF domain-containing protein n=1 Tax=Arenimonas sp. MALMAid1274 TaxID=3411630 RepID=UPI003BA19B0C
MNSFALIDPRTLLVSATLMILLNGGVLGLMHRSLAPDVQPSAVSWRIATLLTAASCVLQVVQASLPAQLVLPLANGCLLLGLTGYWRALRQFDGLPDRGWLLLPALAGTAGIGWYAGEAGTLGARIVVASLAMAAILLASALSLMRHGKGEATTSRGVLVAIMVAIGLLMLLRAGVAAVAPPDVGTLLQLRDGINAVTLLLVTTVPVIGTTAFVLMCLERIRGQWQQAASMDYLTGLANRRTVAQAGERALHAARRQGHGLALGLLDVDHFKRINDRHGHAVGDLALKHLAQRLEQVCRKSDLPGRLGGEEFVLLWDRADAAQALAAAARLQADLQAHPLHVQGAPLPLTVSIGVAVLTADDTHFDDLLRRADRALYAAKSAGRNRTHLA